jgi:type II secretory pathway pseudopilin PulG
MFIKTQGAVRSNGSICGFTLAELLVAMGVLVLVIDGVITGYIHSARRTEWNGRSLAAQSLALQGMEQARAAKWDPQAWPVADELPPTNFTEILTLDVPVSGQPLYATNHISITTITTNPPLRQIRADCAWPFLNGRVFTNTIVTLRAPDQ